MSSEEVYFDKIEAFLSNQMSEEEVIEFKQAIMGDSDLRESVAYHKLADKTIELGREDLLRNTYLEVVKQKGELPVKLGRTSIFTIQNIGIAASIAILLGVFSIANGPQSNVQKIDQYYERPIGVYERTSTTPEIEALIQETQLAFYKEENFEQVRKLMGQITPQNQNYALAQYYIANAYLRDQDYSEAIRIFDWVLNEKVFRPFAEEYEVKWNRLLALMGSGKNVEEFDKALDYFIHSNEVPPYLKDQAIDIKAFNSSFLSWVRFR